MDGKEVTKKVTFPNQPIQRLWLLVLCTLLALPIGCSKLGAPKGFFSKNSAAITPTVVRLRPSKPEKTSPLPLPINRPMQVTFQSDTVLYAAVSGNGARMGFIIIDNGFSHIWIGSPDPDRPVLPRSIYRTAGTLSSPALSKDGKWLAFVGTDHDAKGDIYVIETDNNKARPRRLTGRETADNAPCFSPDGRTLYFQQMRPGQPLWHLVSLSLESGSSQPVHPQPVHLETAGDGSFPAISPDGRRVVFVSVRDDPSGDIFLTHMETGKTVPLTTGSDRDLFPMWSRDGQYVYFSRFALDTNMDGSITPDDNGVIYRVSVQTGDHPPTPYPVTRGSYPAYNPMTTESRLYFLSTRKGAGNVWTLPLEGEIPRQNNGQDQIELAKRLASLVPRDDHLAILGYYKVLEAFSRENSFGGKAAYAIADLYERMGRPNLAKKAYLLTSTSFGATLPEAPLSQIRLIGINARQDWRKTRTTRQRRSKLKEAQRQLESISAKYPARPRVNAQSRIETAHLLMDLGRNSDSLLEAIRLLDQVIKAKTTPPDQVAEAMVLRTDLFARVRSPENLLAGYARVVKEFPGVEQWADLAVERILNLSLKNVRTSKPEDQTRLLSRIAETYRLTIPRLAMGAWNRIGDIYFAADEWLRAKNAYRQVLERFPAISTQTAAARLALAEILYREERFRQALDLYEKEMNTRPYEDHLYLLAKAAYSRKSIAAAEFLFGLGEVPSAQKIFLDLIRDDYSNVQAHRGYIKSAAARKQILEVLTDYRKILEQRPNDPITLYAVGLCLTYTEGKKELKEARSLIQAAIQKQGQIEYFHQTMGYVLEVLETIHREPGRLEEALRSYQKAFFLNNPQNDPENGAHLLLNLGNIYFLLGQYGKAFESYTKRFDSPVPFDNKDTEIQFYRRFGASAFQIRERAQPIEAYSKAVDLIETRIQPKAASEVLGKINSHIFDRILHPVLSPLTEAPFSQGQVAQNIKKARPVAERLAKTQAALNRKLFEVSTRPVAPPPDPSWETYHKAMETLISEQKRIINNLDPLLGRGRGNELQTLLYMLTRASKALDFPKRLIHLKAEMLDRLGLAFQEAQEWQKARSAFEQAYFLNDSLGLFLNLAGNQRSIAFNAYMEAGDLSGPERNRLLKIALKGFNRVTPLVRRYGVTNRGSAKGEAEKRGSKAVMSLTLDVSLDKTTASQAMHGFSPEQEERLAQAFISRIQIELGRLAPAQKALEQQLIQYPSGGPLPDKDLYGVALLYHRAGLLSYARQDPLSAFNRFRDSARLSHQLKNPVSAAINVANMAEILAQMDPENPETVPSRSVLAGLDRQTTRLLDQFSNVLDPLVIPSYHNALGVFSLRISQKIMAPALVKAAQKMAALETAGMHFARGLKQIPETVKALDRKTLGLSAALHLNMAAVALQCAEPLIAQKHFEAALGVAKQGLLPEYQWRALAGLGRLDEALEVLESVTLLRASSGPGEIIGIFSPLVANLLKEEKLEEAFNLLEYLSEIERVHRMTPLFLGPVSLREKSVINRVYKRLLLIDNLESQFARAKEDNKDYLSTRLKQEHKLLSQDLGKNRERLPSFVSLVGSEAKQDRLLILLGLALHAEEVADTAVKEKAASRAHVLRQQYDQLVDQYLEALDKTEKGTAREDPPGIIGVFKPNPVEAIDVMEALPEKTTCFRLFALPDSNKGWMAFVVTPDDILVRKFDPERAMALSDGGSVIVVYEDPAAFTGLISGPTALNATHLVRSIRYRKPFRKTVLAVGTGYPLPHMFNARVLPPGTSDQEILEALPGVNGLLLNTSVHMASTVPTRPGETSRHFPAMDLDQGRVLSLSRILENLSNASLAVLPKTSIENAYDLGHLFSLFGVPTLLLSRQPQKDSGFLVSFFEAYTATSVEKAFQTARNVTRSATPPKSDGNTSGEEWLLMGYWGMTPEEAQGFAQKQFSRYVRSGAAAFKKNNLHQALTLFENALQVAVETRKLNRFLPNLYKYARESAYASGEIQKAITYARALVKIIEKKQPDSQAHAEALLKLGLVLARAEQYEQAVPPLNTAVEILANLELEPEQISALADLGVVLENATEYDRALVKLETAASLSKSLNKKELLAKQAMRIGRILDLRLSQYAQAKKNYQEAYAIYRELGQKKHMAQSLLDMGRCDRLMGNFSEAQNHYDKAMDLVQGDGRDPRLETKILMEVANNAWYQARYQEAFELQKKVFDLARRNGWLLEKVMALNTSDSSGGPLGTTNVP